MSEVDNSNAQRFDEIMKTRDKFMDLYGKKKVAVNFKNKTVARKFARRADNVGYWINGKSYCEVVDEEYNQYGESFTVSLYDGNYGTLQSWINRGYLIVELESFGESQELQSELDLAKNIKGGIDMDKQTSFNVLEMEREMLLDASKIFKASYTEDYIKFATNNGYSRLCWCQSIHQKESETPFLITIDSLAPSIEYKEVIPKYFSDIEIEIAKELKGYEYMVREDTDVIYLHTEKPTFGHSEDCWISNADCESLMALSHLFKSITHHDKPILITDITGGN